MTEQQAIAIHGRLQWYEFMKESMGIKDFKYYMKYYIKPLMDEDKKITYADKVISKDINYFVRQFLRFKKEEPGVFKRLQKKVEKQWKKRD